MFWTWYTSFMLNRCCINVSILQFLTIFSHAVTFRFDLGAYYLREIMKTQPKILVFSPTKYIQIGLWPQTCIYTWNGHDQHLWISNFQKYKILSELILATSESSCNIHTDGCILALIWSSHDKSFRDETHIQIRSCTCHSWQFLKVLVQM